MTHPVISFVESTLELPLNCVGDLELLNRPRRMLLISRAERNPSPTTPWLRAAISATEKLAANGDVLVTGNDRIASDLPLWITRQRGGAAIVVLESAPKTEDEIFHLVPESRLLIWPREPLKPAAFQKIRDKLVALLSDRAFSIYVRKDGNMAAAATTLRERGCAVEEWSAAKTPGNCTGSQKQRAAARGTNASSLDATIVDWPYLTHFTREPDGAWLGENYVDYLRWLASGESDSPRDSFATLQRILSEKRLRACGRLMPNAIPMVCFTALRPHEALALRRWRPGLMRWSFTRYGLAIRKDALTKLHVREVKYFSREVLKNISEIELPFTQVESSGAMNWSAEEEWRIAGDLDLTPISPENLRALVATEDEAKVVREKFGIETQIL